MGALSMGALSMGALSTGGLSMGALSMGAKRLPWLGVAGALVGCRRCRGPPAPRRLQNHRRTLPTLENSTLDKAVASY